MRRFAVLLSFLGLILNVSAQSVSYFNTGLLRQPSAAADLLYLGIPTSGLGTNYVAGSGIAFTHTAPFTYSISATAPVGAFVQKSGDYMSGPLTNLYTMTIRSSISPVFLSFEVQVLPGIYKGTALSYDGSYLTTLAPAIFNGGLNVDLFAGIHAAGITGGGVHFGDGSGLTNIPAASISGLTAQTNISYTSVTNLNSWASTNTTPIANVVTDGRGTIAGLSGTNIWSGSNYFGKDVTIAGTNRVTKLRVGGAAESSDAINVTGTITASSTISGGAYNGSGNITAGFGSTFYILNRSGLSSAANGFFTMYNNANTSFSGLTLGPTKGTWPTLYCSTNNGMALATDGTLTATNGFIIPTNASPPNLTISGVWLFCDNATTNALCLVTRRGSTLVTNRVQLIPYP